MSENKVPDISIMSIKHRLGIKEPPKPERQRKTVVAA